MSKSWKKILITGTTLLMFASVGVNTNRVMNPVHASQISHRISNLRNRRAQDYRNINKNKRDIRYVDTELGHLEHHKSIHYHVKKHSVSRVDTHYRYGSAKWYTANNDRNARYIYDKYNKYDTTNSHGNALMYVLGSNSEIAGGNPTIFRKYAYNRPYRNGWIIANADLGLKPSKNNYTGYRNDTSAYSHAIQMYQSGLNYMRAHHDSSVVNHYRWNPNGWFSGKSWMKTIERGEKMLQSHRY